MLSHATRSRIAYAVGSAAVAWVAAAMIVGAAPGSSTMAKVYPLFQPFLQTFDMQHDWGFFAPDPGTGHVVRYEVRDAGGEVHAFALTEELDRWDPAYFRFTTLYTKASVKDSDYAPGTTRLLCERHADLEPTHLRIIVAHQRPVTPTEYLEGVDPMGDLEIYRRRWRRCEEADSE